MKAIRPPASPVDYLAASLGAAVLLVLLGSCAAPQRPAQTRPAPVQTRPVARPIAQPAPAQPLTPLGASTWRDMPITPGDWVWSNAGGVSRARFANGLLELRCDRASGSVLLIRSDNTSASGPLAMTVSTTTGRRTLTAQPYAGPPAQMVVTLAARDGLLDAMAFSRGRFAVEMTGLAPVYAPNWPEVSRVIEDCR